MISAFEGMVRQSPSRTFLSFSGDSGVETSYSYQEMRIYAAAIAKLLHDKGVRRGDCVAVDLPNSTMFVCLVLAAAYGGHTLILVDHGLSDVEKKALRSKVRYDPRTRIALHVNEGNVETLAAQMRAYLGGFQHRARQGGGQPFEPARAARPSFVTRESVGSAGARSAEALGRVQGGLEATRRREAMARQDALEEAINFADHAMRLYDPDDRAVVAFSTNVPGHSKATALSWRNVAGAARAANASMGVRGGLIQVVRPLHSMEGFQQLMQALIAGAPVLMHGSFDADRTLAEAAQRQATHITVSRRELLALCESGRSGDLKRYSCVLLVNSRDEAALEKAWKKNARVRVCYSLTEAAGQVANAAIDLGYRGGLALLPGYEAHIVDAGEDGFGRLAVKGPGVFEGYIGAHAAWTVDGFFLTRDEAALYNGLLYVKNQPVDAGLVGGK